MTARRNLLDTWTKSADRADYAAAGWVEARPALPKGWKAVGNAVPPPDDANAAEAAGHALAMEVDPNPTSRLTAIGVNVIRFREATKSTDDAWIEAVARDLADLGVSFVRQPGVDLVWPRRPAGPVPIPVVHFDRYGTVDIEPLRQVFRDYASGPLTDLFNGLHPFGINAILTVISWGQAGKSTTAKDQLFPVELDSGVPWWQWVPEHLDRELRLPYGRVLDFNVVESISRGGWPMRLDSATPDEMLWLLETMDIRSPYKRQYMLWMAQAACDVLHEVDGATGGKVFGRLLSIELFNEINLTCLARSNPASTVSAWAKATACTLAGIRASFAGKGTTPPPLGFPSMGGSSSATPWGRAGSTDPMAVTYFLDAFLTELKREVGSLDAFSNLDIHWYHFKSGDDAGRPGACIVQDVRETQKTLVRHGSGATVSMCETGIPGFDGMSLGLVDYAAYPMLDPKTRASPVDDGFQAREVWRRFGIGLASGAARIAWHTHRAEVKGGSAGCGLRDDATSPTVPKAEMQRPAWGAYERVFERLLGSTALTGYAQLVWPTHARYGPDFSTLIRSNAGEMTLVVEYRSPAGNWYYLAMIDSVAVRSAAAPTPTLMLCPVGWKAGIPFTLSVWGTLPAVVSTRATGVYPLAKFDWGITPDPRVQVYTKKYSKQLVWGARPILISSERRLSVDVSV